MARVNEDDLEWSEYDHGEARFRRKCLGAAADGDDLGCTLYEVPAGHTTWPYHYHTANEEAMYVLDGEGTLRLGGTERSIGPGDYVAFPADESGAHKVINNSAGPLRFLLVSTMVAPDVAIYPDSNKLGVFVGGAPGDHETRSITGYYDIDDTVDYWEDE